MKLKDPRLFREQGFIDGSWQGADGGGTLPVAQSSHSPAVGRDPNMGVAETRRAIAAASAAMPAWRPGPPRTGPPSCAVGSI